MALMHLKVYYKFCPTEKQNLAIFPRTISGPDEIALEEAHGACVQNAVQVTWITLLWLLTHAYKINVLTG